MSDNKGLLFDPAEQWRVKRKKYAHMLNHQYNESTEYETEKRLEILHELLGYAGDGLRITEPITFHYGIHTKIGKNTFINFNFTCQDDGPVTIGDNCDIGPNVTVTTAMHPMLASEREGLKCPDGTIKKLCWAKPVTIGDNCWICAGVIILPGVSIGKNSVIGAGSVVTRSIPENCFAAGNPCRVIRTLSESDSLKMKPEILGDCTVRDE